MRGAGSGDARGVGRAGSPVRRDAGHGPADARPGRERRARSAAGRAFRRSSPRSRRRPTTTTRPATRRSASSPDNAELLAALIGAALLGAARADAVPGPGEHPTSTPKHVPEPPDDARPALAYGLAHEGGDIDGHGAGDAARPRRARLLRHEAGHDRGREARPRDLQGGEAPAHRSSSRTRRRCSTSSTS